jgi:quinol monooxygenase YgiN
MVAHSRRESGCRLYLVNRSRRDPDEFVLYEHYDDEAALDAHRDSAHFREIVAGRVIPRLEVREWDLYTLVEPGS